MRFWCQLLPRCSQPTSKHDAPSRDTNGFSIKYQTLQGGQSGAGRVLARIWELIVQNQWRMVGGGAPQTLLIFLRQSFLGICGAAWGALTRIYHSPFPLARKCTTADLGSWSDSSLGHDPWPCFLAKSACPPCPSGASDGPPSDSPGIAWSLGQKFGSTAGHLALQQTFLVAMV